MFRKRHWTLQNMQLPGIKMCTALCITIIRGRVNECVCHKRIMHLTSNNYQADTEWLHYIKITCCPCSHCDITEISFIEYKSVFFNGRLFYNFDKCKLPFLSGLLFLFGIFLFFICTLKFTCKLREFCFQIKCPLPSYRDLQCKNIDPGKISYAYGGIS